MSTMNSTGQSGQRAPLKDVQALRGLAAVMVMCYYTGTIFAVTTNTLLFDNLFRGGFLGVDVFFVLSGFVMYLVHNSDFGDSSALYSFVTKRVLRIFPVYWLVLLAKLIREQQPVDLVVLLCAVFLIPFPREPFITVAWTLSYELLFYSAVALMIVLPKGWLTLVPPAVLLAFGLLPAPSMGESNSVASVLLDFPFNSHLIEFLMGLGVGWVLATRHVTKRLATVMVMLSLVWLVAVFFAGTWLAMPGGNSYVVNAYEWAEVRGNAVFDLGVWLIGLPFSALLLGLVVMEQHRRRAFVPFLEFLGDISYSLYLLHGAVIFALMSIPAVAGALVKNQWMVCFVMLFAVGVSVFFHHAIEKPLINSIRKRI